MTSKRLLDESGSSKNNRTILQGRRRRRLDPNLEEGDAITSYYSLSNKYLETDNPPFLVHLYDTRIGYNIGQYHPLMLAKKLSNNNIHPVRTFKAADDKLAIILSTPSEANNFVNDSELVKKLDPNWRAVIPDSAIYKIGVVHDIPLEITIDEIKEGIDPEVLLNIVKIERCKQRKANPSAAIPPNSPKQEWEDADSIKIICRNSLPRDINIFSYIAKVSAYILPVKQCNRCFKYGHVVNNCRGKEICLKCGESHRIEEAESCMNAVKCVNCLGPHMSNDRNECLFYNYNIEINLARSKLKCDISEAEQIVKDRFKKQYPDVSKQEIISKEFSDPNATLGSSFISFKNPYYISSNSSTTTTPNHGNKNLSVLNRTADLLNKDCTLVNMTYSTPRKSPPKQTSQQLSSISGFTQKIQPRE